MSRLVPLMALLGILIPAHAATAQEPARPRAREWGLVLGVLPPGPLNAITDVPGVMVGHATSWFGEGRSVARCGVTVVRPHLGDLFHDRVPAAGFVWNGCGEMTGLAWVNESGYLEVPILLTDTLNVGRCYDALISWYLREYPELGLTDDVITPVVGECDNSFLNDIRGRHLTEAQVFEALDRASPGPVREGAVGAGTGMTSYDFKGGIGTASRLVDGYTVGVLLNSNHGRRADLVIDGVPVGRSVTDLMPKEHNDGSIIIVVATDAPLDSRQLGRLARRAFLGLGRTGFSGDHGSGDFVIAFSTRNRVGSAEGLRTAELMDDRNLNGLFHGVEEATEEALVNVLFAARTTVGRDGNTAHELPLDRLRELLRAAGRMR